MFDMTKVTVDPVRVTQLADHLENTKAGFDMSEVLTFEYDADEFHNVVAHLAIHGLTMEEVQRFGDENNLLTPECGAVGCMIGHIRLIAFGASPDDPNVGSAMECAQWLGVPHQHRDPFATTLFFGYELNRACGRNLADITRYEAVRHLRAIAAAGHLLPWAKTLGEHPEFFPEGSE